MTTTPDVAPLRRDDMMLGAPEQDYILHIERRDAAARDAEVLAAALTVCGKVGSVYPDLTGEQVATEARLILNQLGLLEERAVREHVTRRRTESPARAA